jgi:hypothetical protein
MPKKRGQKRRRRGGRGSSGGVEAEARRRGTVVQAVFRFKFKIENLGSWRQAEMDNRYVPCPSQAGTRMPSGGCPPGVVASELDKLRHPISASQSPVANAAGSKEIARYQCDCVRMPPSVIWV